MLRCLYRDCLAETIAGTEGAARWRIVNDRESGRLTCLCPRHARLWDTAWDEWVRYQRGSAIPPEPPLGLSSD